MFQFVTSQILKFTLAFLHNEKKSGQKCKHFENERAFKMKQKALFNIFKGISLKQKNSTFLGESPTLNEEMIPWKLFIDFAKLEICWVPILLWQVSAKIGSVFCLSAFLLHDHSQITGLQGKGGGISLTHHYHFHSHHRYLEISWTITADSQPLHIASNRTQPKNPSFLSACH